MGGRKGRKMNQRTVSTPTPTPTTTAIIQREKSCDEEEVLVTPGILAVKLLVPHITQTTLLDMHHLSSTYSRSYTTGRTLVGYLEYRSSRDEVHSNRDRA